MPRIIDVVDHVNVMEDELSYREPQQGSGDWRFGSQVLVAESQVAVFVRGGTALDILQTGRNMLSTANLPILAGLIGLATSGRTPFTADLYFINMKDMPNTKWGTTSPIPIETPGRGLGAVLLRTFGTMNLTVVDPMLFLKKLGVGKPITRINDIKDAIQTKLIGELTVWLSGSGVQSIMDANAMLNDLEGAALAGLSEGFEADFGIRIKSLDANPFTAKEATPDEMMNYVSLDIWERAKRIQIAETAAGNEGMGGALASAGVGFGVGQQIGGTMNPQLQEQQNQQAMMNNMMMQKMMEMMNNSGGQQQSAPAQTAPPSSPQTPAEIQAFIDGLDMKLMSGEISESIYNRLLEKWQKRLDEVS